MRAILLGTILALGMGFIGMSGASAVPANGSVIALARLGASSRMAMRALSALELPLEAMRPQLLKTGELRSALVEARIR